MESKTTKTVKVSEDKAEKWENYVAENPEADSISHLIRMSVQKEINGEYDFDQRREAVEEGGANSGEVLTRLQQIQTALDNLDQRVSGIESLETAEASYDLKKAVWELLPEEPEEVVDDEIPAVWAEEGLDKLDVVTPQEIARRLGADVDDVEEVLDDLAENTGQVQRSDKNHDGNHYWRKGA